MGGFIVSLEATFSLQNTNHKYKDGKKGQKMQEQSAVQQIYNRLASTLTCKCCETSHFMAAARNYSLNYWHLRPASGHQETPGTKGEGVGCALRAVKPEWLNQLLRWPSAIQNSQQHKTIPFCAGAHLSCTLKFCTSSPLAHRGSLKGRADTQCSRCVTAAGAEAHALVRGEHRKRHRPRE